MLYLVHMLSFFLCLKIGSETPGIRIREPERGGLAAPWHLLCSGGSTRGGMIP